MRALLCSLLLLTGCTDEPEYFGRKLSLWIRELDASSEIDRKRACEVLASMGGLAAPAVEALTRKLEDSSPAVREGAITALAAIGLASTAPLEKALASDSPEVRADAASA